MFSIAVLPHSPGVIYYHLSLRQETRFPRFAPFSFQMGIWDLFFHRGQKSHTPTAFGKLWTTPGVRCIIHASSYCDPGMRPIQDSNQGPLDQRMTALLLNSPLITVFKGDVLPIALIRYLTLLTPHIYIFV